jgi:histidine ammonia-lyase
MGVTAAHKAAQVVANTRRVLAVELVAAAEALEFRRPLRSSPALEAVVSLLRTQVAARERDRVVGPDIEKGAVLIGSGQILDAAEAVCGRLEGHGGHPAR